MARNDSAEILAATDELLRTLIEANELQPDDIVSGLFTVTNDLDAAFPARAAEEFGWNIVALLHATEIRFQDCYRSASASLGARLHGREQGGNQQCYLRGATGLRHDRA